MCKEHHQYIFNTEQKVLRIVIKNCALFSTSQFQDGVYVQSSVSDQIYSFLLPHNILLQEETTNLFNLWPSIYVVSNFLLL